MNIIKKGSLIYLALLSNTSVIAAPSILSTLPTKLQQGHATLQLGGYWSNQGQKQHININTLIGDEFTVTNNGGSNGLVGLGYFIDGAEKQSFNMSYGLNMFYLAKTSVSGNVIQENLFTNLAYQYNLTHYPLYAIAKSTWNTPIPKYNVTIDAGIGPNFMRADGFKERSLDKVTVPDRIFASNTSTTFSATVGLGVKVNQFFGPAPLECGYRFYYLGNGSFNVANNQVLNNLSTGESYANAIMCAISV